MAELLKLNDIANDLVIRAADGVHDHTSTVDEAVKAYSGGLSLETGSGSERMTKKAAGQLFKMVGLPVSVLGHFKDAPELQIAMAQNKLEGLDTDARDRKIICRGHLDGDGNGVLDTFLSDSYVPVSNAQMIMAMKEGFDGEGVDARVHQSQISDRQMSLRIVAPEWDHDLGGGDMAYTGLSLINSELGTRAVTVRASIARVACFNYTLADNDVFSHEHRFLTPEEILNGVVEGIRKLNGIAGEISDRLRGMRDVEIEDAKAMIGVMSNEMGLPNYVTNPAYQWWEDTGAVPNLFYVVQAIAFAAANFTSRKGFAWDRREMAETQSFRMAEHYQDTGKLQLCECPRCHRPMNSSADTIDADYEVIEE